MTGTAATAIQAPVVRPLRASDLAFVHASWLESFRDGSVKHWPEQIAKAAYFKGQRLLIEALLMRPAVRGAVAVTPDYDEAILGWAVAEGKDCLHYAYTKDAFRHLGIAKSLFLALELDPMAFTFTHLTRRGRELLDQFPGARFNPYLLFPRS